MALHSTGSRFHSINAPNKVGTQGLNVGDNLPPVQVFPFN